MKHLALSAVVAFGFMGSGAALAQAQIGQPAPAFSGTDTAGKQVSLADFKGKYVVLEWVNPDCPFVKKHYKSGNMQSTQKHAAAKGAAWVSLNTSGAAADPKTAASLGAWSKEQKAVISNLVLDKGNIGRAYGARTTPHMYVIDPAGKLVYAGAIDSKPSASADDIPGATNYVVQALDELAAGKAVSKPVTQPYGCTVKYDTAG
ncbi:redoxin domain-containing protein [Pseudoduganella sp.]|uniref:redoxin domain-containing protein n=1 Tax=Pseudoduganella sp. TaxID=1880898 RepID=UPI0035AFE191